MNTQPSKVNLRNVDLNLLVALDALLSEGSVTRAAERLHCGQSAMSASLSRLRRLFGDQILIKSGRGLTATPFARSLVGPLREVIGQIDALLSANAAFDPMQDNREFRITANDYVATVLLRPLIARLAVEAPGMHLAIESVHSDFAGRLERGDTDLLVLPQDVYPAHQQFPNDLLFRDRYVAVVDAENSDVGASLTLDEFSQQPYLAVNIGALPSSAERQLDGQGILRNVQVTIQTFTLAPSMLRGTRLLCLVQERLLQASEVRHHLRTVELPISLRPISMIMLWGARSANDPAHQWLRGELARVATELSQKHID
ncbi:LysR family transcriptional regulator [Saccharopolyspora sp. NPDC049357]|uniref:LysR family transcriptional regulator n=1 Tax=Saccharopolyspora sp. NPDC049357 TaxID=3154507 RepID=UPI0034435DF7